MTLSGSLPPSVICAENIALLYLLHSVPASPSYNKINDVSFPQEYYLLSLTEERNLASTLAFLSNTEDDPNHVPAICVKENQESASLNIFLAVNKAKWDDGNEVLWKLEQNFGKIFAILSEISEDKYDDKEHRIFTTIVSMCSYRILGRLRFISRNRSKPKQPFKLVVWEAVNSLQQRIQQNLHTPPIESFIQKAKEVVRLVDAWSKHQKPKELENLVEGIHGLKQVGNIHALLDLIPNRDMCPSSRRNLANIVSKVSRYREAASFLYRTARKAPLLQRMKVVPVNLPREAFSQLSCEDSIPELASTIRRTGAPSQDLDLSHLARLLNTTDSHLNEQFIFQARKTLREAKIHAEVQLVFHCELNVARPPPRVVCSSKDACFLCNAFILMHGKMHTPRCHGRLYPGWKIPLIPGLNDLDRRFNSTLENQIESSMKLLFSTRRKTIYPDPNESTLLTIPLSTSTLHEETSLDVGEGEESSTKNKLVDDTFRFRKHLSPRSRSSSSSETFKSVSLILDLGNTTTVQEDSASMPGLVDESETHISSPDNSHMTTSEYRVADNLDLVQGITFVSHITNAQKSKLHTAEALNIHIELMLEKQPDTNEKYSEMSYSVEWISEKEKEELLRDEVAMVVDAEALQSEISHELDKRKGLIITARGVFVRIIPLDGSVVHKSRS